MMIGTLLRLRSARQTSVPDSPGSIRSSSTMSAPPRSNSASASGPVLGDDDLEALPAQHVGQRVGEGLLVLHHQHAGHARSFSTASAAGAVDGGVGAVAGGVGSGMRRVNVEPSPSSLHTVTAPPWLLATCLTMARPRPVPPVLLARAWSTR